MSEPDSAYQLESRWRTASVQAHEAGRAEGKAEAALAEMRRAVARVEEELQAARAAHVEAWQEEERLFAAWRDRLLEERLQARLHREERWRTSAP